MNIRSVAAAWLAAALLMAGNPTSAGDAAEQPGPPPLETLVTSLNLSKAQQERLKPLVAAAREQVRADMADARRNDERFDSPEFAARLRTLEADLREKVQGLLSAQQLARYDAMSEQRTPRRSPGVTVHGHHEMDTPQTVLER